MEVFETAEQADAFDGYRKLHLPDGVPAPNLEAARRVHARRPFFAMADLDENARRRAVGKKTGVLTRIASYLRIGSMNFCQGTGS